MRATRASLGRRLGELKLRLLRTRGSGFRDSGPGDEAEWLVAFERLGAAGRFDREPGFPTALALFRDALARASVSADPPFEPPPNLLRGHPVPTLRPRLWRTPERFLELCEAFAWLTELLDHAVDGIPPVSEAKFAELAAWFRTRDDDLFVRSLPSQLLDLGGRDTSSANVRWALAQGPRAAGAGCVAEDVRQLKARYGAASKRGAPG